MCRGNITCNLSQLAFIKMSHHAPNVGPQADTNDVDWGLWHTQHLQQDIHGELHLSHSSHWLPGSHFPMRLQSRRAGAWSIHHTCFGRKRQNSYPVNHLPSSWALHLDNPLAFHLVPFPPEGLLKPVTGTPYLICGGGGAVGSERFDDLPNVSTVSGKAEIWTEDQQANGWPCSGPKAPPGALLFLSDSSLSHQQPKLTLSSSTPTRSLLRKREISRASLTTFSTAEK